MSRVRPGRPAKGEWARATSTAEPGMVYAWYFDVKIRCKKFKPSPKLEPIDPEVAESEYEGYQTIYLGTYETVEFRTIEPVMKAEKIAAWELAHPECSIVQVFETYRHYRGTSL